jgi:hypothetical protein
MKALLYLLFIALVASCNKKDKTRSAAATSTVPAAAASSTAVSKTVRISNVIASPTKSESVTLQNTGKTSIDLTGWTLGDRNDPTHYHFSEGQILDAGFSQTFMHTKLGFGINDSGEQLYLRNASGATIDTWQN